MISLKNLSYGYSKVLLYDDLCAEFEPGRIYGFLGKNGAGKTTLFKLMAGLLQADTGTCTVLGAPGAARLPHILGDICYVPEQFHLPAVPISTYVALHAPLYPHFDHNRFTVLLGEYEIDASGRLNRLSYGQRKKFSLAFGIASGCRIMLLDEPTNGLDIPSKRVLRRQLAAAVNAERTIVIATHQVREIENIFDTVMVVDNGKILLNRPVADVARVMKVKMVTSLDECPEHLYAEEVPGGFSVIVPNDGNEEGAMDMEFLFNAVVSGQANPETWFGDSMPVGTEVAHA